MTRAANLFRLEAESLMRKWAPRLKNRAPRVAVGAFVVFCLLFGTPAVYAAFTPDVMKFTITAVAFRKTGQSTFDDPIAVVDGEIDVAQPDPGGQVSNILTDIPIEAGEYDRLQFTISCIARMKFSFTTTTPGGSVTIITTAIGTVVQGLAEDAAEGPFDLGCTGTFQKEFPATVTVTAGGKKTVFLDVDAAQEEAQQQGEDFNPEFEGSVSTD